MLLSSFQLQGQQLRYKNGRTAWNGSVAYHDNGRTAWNGSVAYHYNGRTAWNGSVAYHDNGRTAWNGSVAYYDNGRAAWNGFVLYYDNGRTAWNGFTAYDENARTLSRNLYTQIRAVKLDNLKLNELEISDKIKLLTKTLNKRAYVVGLKIHLSEKNSVLINRENNLTTNIIQLNKDTHFEILNKRPKLSVLGKSVINQLQ